MITDEIYTLLPAKIQETALVRFHHVHDKNPTSLYPTPPVATNTTNFESITLREKEERRKKKKKKKITY